MKNYILFPFWILSIMLTSYFLIMSGVDGAIVVMLSALLTLIFVTTLERLFPFKKEWNKQDGDFYTDLASFSVVGLLLDPILKVVGSLLSLLLIKYLHFTPEVLPVASWQEFVFVLLFAEFGKYWIHRWHHQGWPWEFHAMHHSPRRLYGFNNSRIHPLNYLFNSFASTIPLLLIGVSAQSFAMYSILAISVSFFQHANLELKFGYLNYLFSTNELHRWHHSMDLKEGNTNFGATLSFWDILFNTFYYPAGKSAPFQLGVSTPKLYPRKGYIAQLLWPMRKLKICCC
jgi:sterol desaturase/sphingolipid hydroxylase (fatty acid hydroxylase superfamily)